ncbi:hypothetical protein CCR75_003126 [Bremia lactucae]|uniref:ACB domain-containing protein n=1 Tax=Bremia lactucae TaxID=4779 RepID=A0A976FHG7_BRELC|nr:hypothetical protein CCR75_003126 [Bremia lactucae]
MANELAEMTWLSAACAAAVTIIASLLLHRICFCDTMPIDNSSGTCSLDEYMIEHSTDELDAKFQVAVDFISARGQDKLTNEQKLVLYALYKQAKFGSCNVEKPSAIDMVGLAKWESWKALGAVNQDVAKQHYLEWVQDSFEEFDVRAPIVGRSLSKAAKMSMSLKGSMGMAGAISIPKVDMSTEEWKVKEDVFHYASTGDVDKILAALNQGENVNVQDLEGRTMLHWAVDREHTTVVEELLRREASPNIQDSDGMTPLHYAASCEHEALARLLVTYGALVDIKDIDGDTPLLKASSHTLQLIMTNKSTSESL